MRWLLVAAAACVVALLTTFAAVPASADEFTDTWLRGTSSVAFNDDATALFVNPAGLGIYESTNSYTAVSLSGDDVLKIEIWRFRAEHQHR